MKSQIILTVEHGESTDDIQSYVECVGRYMERDSERMLKLLDYEVKVDTEAEKIILPEEIYDAILSCSGAAENTDSDRLIREGQVLRDWLATHCDWAD